MPKITKAEFDSLYDDNISKKKYDAIIAKIDTRFYEIVSFMAPRVNEGEDSGGYFEPEDYKEEIAVGGSWAELPPPYDYESDNSFPTRWLWEDFEEEFKREVAKAKQKEVSEKLNAKQKRDDLKARKATMRPIIEAKLTKEELKYITFK